VSRLACLAFAVAVPTVAASAQPAGAAPPEAVVAAIAATAAPLPARQRELLTLLHQDCGSCHGLRLTGGLGPALTPEALSTRPAESLVATIVSGRSGTAMAPWRRFVSEAEAAWLVSRMRSGATDASP